MRLNFQQAGLGNDERIERDEGWMIYPEGCSEDGLRAVSAMLEGSVAQARLIGGEPGQTYFATAHIRTDQARDLKRTVVVRVSNNKERTR